MNNPIDQIAQRTQRYWYVDGLAEMAGGTVILLLGLFFLAITFVPDTPVRNWLLMLGQPGLILLGLLGSRKAIAYFKERITYPRTGYVSYKRSRGGRRIQAIVVTAVFAAILAIVVSLAGSFVSENWLPIISATLVALFILYLAYQFGLRRFYAISVIAFLLGLATAWLALPDPYTTVFFFSALGLVWILSGAWTLALYLRETQPSVAEEGA